MYLVAPVRNTKRLGSGRWEENRDGRREKEKRERKRNLDMVFTDVEEF